MPNVDEIAKKIREATQKDNTQPTPQLPTDKKARQGVLGKGLPYSDLLDEYIDKIRKGMVDKNENR